MLETINRRFLAEKDIDVLILGLDAEFGCSGSPGAKEFRYKWCLFHSFPRFTSFCFFERFWYWTLLLNLFNFGITIVFLVDLVSRNWEFGLGWEGSASLVSSEPDSEPELSEELVKTDDSDTASDSFEISEDSEELSLLELRIDDFSSEAESFFSGYVFKFWEFT